MKKGITIGVIILLALGFGYYLFTLSGTDQNQTSPGGNREVLVADANAAKISEPRPVDAEDHVLGNKDAKNTFLVYGDFQCPACRSYESVVKSALTELKDTKIVFRHFPLFQIHPNAIASAYAAEAASAQGKFWEMHDKLYETQAEWSNLSDPSDKFALYAQAIGVADIEKFKKDVAEKTFKSRIQKDFQEATSLDVQGTPTVYFNNRLMQRLDLPSIKKEAESLYK